MRIFQIAKELNISHKGIISFLETKGIKVKLMDSIDEQVHHIILAEFSKEKETVDRYRKEQVRKEIHDKRVRQKQKEKSKLQLLSINDQRNIEKEEIQKINKEKEKVEKEKKRLERKDQKHHIKDHKTKNVQEKEKKKKMRKIEISDIESEIGQMGRKRPVKENTVGKKTSCTKKMCRIWSKKH